MQSLETKRAKARAKAKIYRATYPDKANAASRAWKAAHPERVQAYRKANRLKLRHKHLARSFGLTQSAFDDLLENQGGACAICGTREWGGHGGSPSVDHDHLSGKVRAILCSNCNSALGLIKDDPKILQAMIDYLRRHASEAQEAYA